MRVRILSDLHLEFMGNGAARFIGSLPNTDVDVLILAGDITSPRTEISKMLWRFRDRFDCPILYVLGNHEYYNALPKMVLYTARKACDDLPDVHVLQNDTVEIDGQRFLGGTLWFEEPPPDKKALKGVMNDFFTIKDFEPWVYEQNAATRTYLAKNVRKGDIVITHHMPSHVCVHRQYIGNPLNRFFLGSMTMELDLLIQRTEPALWVHGHTHESVDTYMGSTRIICNPFGYRGDDWEATNPNFNLSKTWDSHEVLL